MPRHNGSRGKAKKRVRGKALTSNELVDAAEKRIKLKGRPFLTQEAARMMLKFRRGVPAPAARRNARSAIHKHAAAGTLQAAFGRKFEINEEALQQIEDGFDLAEAALRGR